VLVDGIAPTDFSQSGGALLPAGVNTPAFFLSLSR